MIIDPFPDDVPLLGESAPKIEQIDDLFSIEIQKQSPKWHAAALGPQIEARVGERGKRQVNDALMRTQPAKLRMLRKFLGNRSEIRHQFFDFPANQFLAKPFNRFANQLVPQAKRKHDAGAEDLLVGPEQGGGKCILGSRVYCVATRALLQRKARVACFE